MDKFSYIYKTEFRKMGKWNLLPLDSNGNWHSEETSKYFKKIFGFGKGTFIIQTLDDDIQHAYFPQFYIDKVYNYIEKTNKEGYKKLEKIVSQFYSLREIAKREIPKVSKVNLQKLSNKELLKVYLSNRDWAHRVTPFDQFGWIAEDYWNPIMKKILVKHGLKDGSKEYFAALFILTKPEEISTTLLEKRSVLEQTIKINENKSTVEKSAKTLARQFGWMPVFTFGEPWDAKHYEKELNELKKQSLNFLVQEYRKLKNYKAIRNQEIKQLQNKYEFNPQDLQKFIDFSLCLDARNEAEYVVSFAGFYLLPIYNEIARRLFVSVKQLRNMVKKEVVACLEGRQDPQEIFEKQGDIIGWVFDKSMIHMKYLNAPEAQKFFNYLNKYSKNLQGNDELKGVCASPGKVSGKAVVIHYPSENEKVKSGNILITHATTVDYLPAMKRAAAFVTEIGGLTCHAAVVAREFGVPCIVSLKNATKKFKTGDLVEIDANNGIVKRL